ncbi:MAG TPA: flavoprotein [Desulfosporosinus sp.]|nr:flavoprotein [Desulfosporosinus sp.]
MNEELINQIVRRILSDPSLQGLLQGNGSQEGVVKSEALVLLNFVSDFPRVLAAVKQRWGADFTFCILPSDQVYIAKPELPVGMTWITAQDALSRSDWQKLILPTCSPNTLAKAALGIRDNPICEMIGRGLSRGSSIDLVTDYLGLTIQTPLAYRELYEGYIQRLQAYGVMVCASLAEDCSFSAKPVQQYPAKISELSSVIYKQNEVFSQEKDLFVQEEIRFANKFLGDKQAYEFPEESRVLIKQGTVVSPLARDTLKLRRIELCIEKEGKNG